MLLQLTWTHVVDAIAILQVTRQEKTFQQVSSQKLAFE
jgi:hypothetical protein